MYIGIDPGTVNLGLALVEDSGLIIHTQVLNMKDSNNMLQFIDMLIDLCRDHIPVDSSNRREHINRVVIERFVPYAGTFSSDSERIVMLIGGLQYAFHETHGSEVLLLRAIEWKPKLCKDLYKKKKFNNPSTKFDKKFSHAAATCITGQKFKTDHEADAVCLAYYDKI